MKIRRAEPKDYARVMELYTGLVEDDTRFVEPGNDSFDFIISAKNRALFVAEDDGDLIGIAGVSTRRVVRYKEPIAQLEELYVDPQSRTKGTGRALVEAAEGFAREQGCNRFYIESGYKNEPAHSFYERIDYIKDGVYFRKIF